MRKASKIDNIAELRPTGLWSFIASGCEASDIVSLRGGAGWGPKRNDGVSVFLTMRTNGEASAGVRAGLETHYAACQKAVAGVTIQRRREYVGVSRNYCRQTEE